MLSSYRLGDLVLLDLTENEKFNWYCWNGTKNMCKYNKLPLEGINVRNSGLVFQSDNFVSTIL